VTRGSTKSATFVRFSVSNEFLMGFHKVLKRGGFVVGDETIFDHSYMKGSNFRSYVEVDPRFFVQYNTIIV